MKIQILVPTSREPTLQALECKCKYVDDILFNRLPYTLASNCTPLMLQLCDNVTHATAQPNPNFDYTNDVLLKPLG
jgi:hypothetical protein